MNCVQVEKQDDAENIIMAPERMPALSHIIRPRRCRPDACMRALISTRVSVDACWPYMHLDYFIIDDCAEVYRINSNVSISG